MRVLLRVEIYPLAARLPQLVAFYRDLFLVFSEFCFSGAVKYEG
jgi:hypothetical protein